METRQERAEANQLIFWKKRRGNRRQEEWDAMIMLGEFNFVFSLHDQANQFEENNTRSLVAAKWAPARRFIIIRFVFMLQIIDDRLSFLLSLLPIDIRRRRLHGNATTTPVELAAFASL